MPPITMLIPNVTIMILYSVIYVISFLVTIYILVLVYHIGLLWREILDCYGERYWLKSLVIWLYSYVVTYTFGPLMFLCSQQPNVKKAPRQHNATTPFISSHLVYLLYCIDISNISSHQNQIYSQIDTIYFPS